MTGESNYCQNCRRDIAAANYALHSVHCERNIQLCTICNEPVPRTEMEQHLEDNHSYDACDLCNVGVEKWLMDKHKNVCCKRPVSCEFCQLDFPFDELDEHKYMCGARTEKCNICKEYVKLVDQDGHREVCQQEWKANLHSVCEYCRKDVPNNLYRTHVSACGSQTEKCPKCGYFVLLSEKNMHECKIKGRNIECGFCNLSMPTDIFGQHISTCGYQMKDCPKCSASIMLKDRKTHKCESPNKINGTCAFCHESVPWIDLREHESACRLSTCTYSSEEEEEKKKPKFSAIPMHQKKRENYRQIDTRSSQRLQETPLIHTLNQCPHCKERYPDLIIADHVGECLQRPVTCELCLETMLLKHVLDHQTKTCKMIYGKIDEFAGNENRSSAVPPGFSKSYEKKVKQCSYCKKKFPEVMFQDHLEICEERPYQCSLCLKMMAIKNKINHDPNECTYIDKVKRQFLGNENSYLAGASGFTKSYDKKMKLCSHCNKKFPELMFQEHSDMCEERPYQCDLCLKMMPWRKKINHDQKECFYRDKVNRHFPGSVGTHTKDAPVYKKPFEKGPLEINFQICHHCHARIPEAKLAEHEQFCFQGKTLCRFCGILIQKEQETVHLHSCIGAKFQVDAVEEREFQTAGSKKSRKKNKKQVQSKPVEQKNSWFPSMPSIFSRNRSNPAKEEFPAPTYFQQPEVVLLPCEFCDELFPEALIIEHQSGCRPDLVSLPQPKPDDRRGSPENDPQNYRDARSTGALPKRNRFHQNNPDDNSSGPIYYHQNPPKEEHKERGNYHFTSGVPESSRQSDVDVIKPGKKPFPAQEEQKERDYYNYPSGVPDSSRESDVDVIKRAKKSFPALEERDYYNFRSGVPDSKQSKVDVIDPAKKLFLAEEVTSSNETSYEPEEKKVTAKNSSPAIFNFSSSSKKSTSNQEKPPLSIYSSPPRKGYSDDQNSEMRAVGAERAERKGIIRISRDTSINLGDLSDEAPDTNYQAPNIFQNSDSNYEKKDHHSPKVQYSEGKFNIPFADETTNIVESEKIKSSCATRLMQQLNISDASENNPEPWDVTEDDAKNEETFGNNYNPRVNRSLSNEGDNLSDSGEHFYDAEDDLKISNIEGEDGSTFMDKDLDVYLQFLMKDGSFTPNGNRNESSPSSAKGKATNCDCGNEICYCNIIHRTAATENNNYLQPEAEGNLQQENIPAESLKLTACSNAKNANIPCEETRIMDSENHLNNVGVEKPSPKWDKWRSTIRTYSDSE